MWRFLIIGALLGFVLGCAYIAVFEAQAAPVEPGYLIQVVNK